MAKSEVKLGWNYRVMRRKYPGSDVEEYGIYEVYYNEEDKPNGWTENARPIVADSLEGLRWIHKKIAEALEKPVLEYNNEEQRCYTCGQEISDLITDVLGRSFCSQIHMAQAEILGK